MRRVVIQFDFRGGRTGSYWLVLERTDVSVCLQHPKSDIDLRVTADINTFYRVWLGRITLGEAMRERLVRFEGPSAVIRAFPNWFAWSPMVNVVRAASTRRVSLAASKAG
jgi:SCP-2 sterol transfer family